jgi:hypothetical protein
MERSLGQIVQEFDGAVRGLRAALARNPDIEAAVFSGAESWLDLLTYMLVPHVEG